MNRIVMTGPTGAIGTALIALCIERGIEVYALCRPGSRRRNRIREHELVHVVECGLEELEKLEAADIPACDVFYHLGWAATVDTERDNTFCQAFNIRYTLDAVRLAERLGCRAFVGAGSQAEYGRYEGKLSPDVPAFPENAYGAAKLCAGQLSRIECKKRKIRHVWARILSVYGPGEGEETMIISVIRKLLDGEKPALTLGEQQWDYLYSFDAAEALLSLGEKGKDGRTYCLGSGSTRSIAEYVRILRDAIDREAPLGFGEVPYGDKQVMYLCADISDLKQDTGYAPCMPYEEGIIRTIDWVKEQTVRKQDLKIKE